MASKESNASPSSTIVNVPEVKSIDVTFNYNFYVVDERTRRPDSPRSGNLTETLPRYVKISWFKPQISKFKLDRPVDPRSQKTKKNYIKENISKIVFEDDFSPNYVSFVFSDVQDIRQGSEDIEVAARINNVRTESVFQMAAALIGDIAKETDMDSEKQQKEFASIAQAYTSLADFPDNSLGLKVVNGTGAPSSAHDTSEFLNSISENLSLNAQLNSFVVPDLFVGSKLKNVNFKFLNENSIAAKAGGWPEQINLPLTKKYSSTLNNRSVYMRGYLLKRYLVTPDGFQFEEEFYIEDFEKNFYIDKNILYGKTYIYSLSVIAEMSVLIYDKDNKESSYGNVLVASRPISKSIECFEYIPPPPPEDIKFSYDFQKNNLIISWGLPVNTQDDIKQIQIMRRKSIEEPFELIAQYSWDTSDAGDANLRYGTGEIVDGNRTPRSDLSNLVKTSSTPIYIHVDDDFYIDKEFSTASSYIYSICTVDAHGMISNYSAQHLVTFDSYKNKLVSKVVCDANSPRQYPNMNLKMDAFKDCIKLTGYGNTKMTVYFNPEYLKVLSGAKEFRIVNGSDNVSADSSPYYLLQLMNLDNQKMQLVKIQIYDKNRYTH